MYLPSVIELESNNEVISQSKGLSFLLNTTSYFMIFLYTYHLAYYYYVSNKIDKNGIGLTFVYLKHILDIIITPNMSMIEYETNRAIMWCFTTPLMLKMYCDANNLSLKDIHIHYHIISIVPYVFIIPFKHQYRMGYMVTTFLLYIPGGFFMKSLYKYRRLPFTNLYIIIWSVFMLINLLEISQLCNPFMIHAFYNIADTLCKFICNVVISNYNEQESLLLENMDLQSVHFIIYIIKSMQKFEVENQKISTFCRDFINHCKKIFTDKIPRTDSRLKLELLKKILPFDLDRDYMKVNASIIDDSTNTSVEVDSIGVNKKFDFICVLFMDIVNYTELANKYNGDIIFKLLNSIYSHFDTIIKKYPHLQKIETIGDAYMVVGDIYRNCPNHKEVVKEIILLGREFIKEIKTVKTPDNVPLCIRIGITMGSVNIGILGTEVPRLCVVGNTVNKASRLQSTADKDTIQISKHLYEQIGEIDFGFDIPCIEKQVFLKNIGTVYAYTIIPLPNTI